jgi:hypothetical protein
MVIAVLSGCSLVASAVNYEACEFQMNCVDLQHDMHQKSRGIDSVVDVARDVGKLQATMICIDVRCDPVKLYRLVFLVT